MRFCVKQVKKIICSSTCILSLHLEIYDRMIDEKFPFPVGIGRLQGSTS